MAKVNLNKVTAVVALSYLVLLPVGGFLIWKKVRDLDEDMEEVWNKLELGKPEFERNAIEQIFWGRRRN